MITESPIDALSFRQLEAASQQIPPTMYVATCGTLSASLQEELCALFQRTQEQYQQVFLAFDSDQAGVKMTEQVASLLQEEGIDYHVIPLPSGHKDWNEVIQHEQMEQARQRAHHQLLAFKQTAPEQSLLKDLGIASAAS